MLVLDREAESAKWAAEQVRRGALLPPAIQADLFESRVDSCLALKADCLLFATMACELAREIERLEAEVEKLGEARPSPPPEPPQRPPLPWWRRAWIRLRGGP